jgi:hypothetical protein
VRNRFPPPTSLKQLEDIIQEEWYEIPLETVHDLYGSILRRNCCCIEGKRWSNTILIKEMFTVFVVFPLFCPIPVCKKIRLIIFSLYNSRSCC